MCVCVLGLRVLYVFGYFVRLDTYCVYVCIARTAIVAFRVHTKGKDIDNTPSVSRCTLILK